VYKQKVKHLLYEHQNNITTLKADGELAVKLQQDDSRKNDSDLTKDKRSLKLELKEQVRCCAAAPLRMSSHSMSTAARSCGPSTATPCAPPVVRTA
jgi:hypothetical protein